LYLCIVVKVDGVFERKIHRLTTGPAPSPPPPPSPPPAPCTSDGSCPTAAGECDVCHLHYYHKVLNTRLDSHFSSHPCRHNTALRYPGTDKYLSPLPNVAGLTTAPPLLRYVQDVSSAEVFGTDVKQCREYQSESCCSATVAGRCERRNDSP
jgi:hypothetical protein